MRNLYNVRFVTKQTRKYLETLEASHSVSVASDQNCPVGFGSVGAGVPTLQPHKDDSQVSSRVVPSCPYKAWLWHPREELPVLKCGGFVSAELLYHLPGAHLHCQAPACGTATGCVHGQSSYENSENSVLAKFGQLCFVYEEHLRTCSKQGIREVHWL